MFKSLISVEFLLRFNCANLRVCCRQGYLAALSASAFSYVSMLQRFGPFMNSGGAAVSLTYLASERIVPGARPLLLRDWVPCVRFPL